MMRTKESGKKLKIMTIFGTRPEIIKLSRVFAKLDKYTNHIMVFTGQSFDYEMSEIFFKQLGVRKADYFLEVKSASLGQQVAKILEESEKVFKTEMPDALLIAGDTNSGLSAIIAKRMKIPIFHMEAGNRSFDDNIPEEINRRIIDHISDINLPYSENARHNLLREGLHPANIIITGSPMAEIFLHNAEKIKNSDILNKLKLKPNRYFVASFHREENVDNVENLEKILESLNASAVKYSLPIIVSTHPRTSKRLRNIKIKMHKLVRFEKPFGYFEYMSLQKNSFCVLSDSGTMPEDSAIFQFPAVQIRNSSERSEAYDVGVTILAGLDKDIILQAIDVEVDRVKRGEKISIPDSYRDINMSDKILRHILGLTKIVKKRRLV